MKTALCSLVLSVSFLFSARGDLTIVYSSTMTPAATTGNDEAAEPARAGANMTIKIRGDRARIDASPQLTTIFDGKTGEVINLLNFPLRNTKARELKTKRNPRSVRKIS